jgi:LPXTG-motif cell wall-anchored protein
MVRQFCIAALLMTMAGVASAGDRDRCEHFWCKPDFDPKPVRAPEIDPASAMAGLTMLAGGLAVLRGRRRKQS